MNIEDQKNQWRADAMKSWEKQSVGHLDGINPSAYQLGYIAAKRESEEELRSFKEGIVAILIEAQKDLKKVEKYVNKVSDNQIAKE